MPPNALLTRLVEERAGHVEFVDTTLALADENGRDLVPAELNNLETARQRIAEIDAQTAPLVAFEEARASAVRIDAIMAPARPVEARAYTTPRPSPETSFGSRIAESDEFRAWQAGNPARMAIDVVPSEIRATLVTTAPPGSMFVPAPLKWAAPAPATSTPLLDAITHVPVSGGSVDIVSYGNFATGAEVVGEGLGKPEATLTATSTPTPLETIAAWVEVSRQLLQDAPAARAIIDSQLTRGVLRKLEDEVASAIEAAAIPDAVGAAGTPTVGVIRQASALVQGNGFSPNVVIANPADFAAIDLDVMNATLNGANASSAYWGLTPVPVPTLTPGQIFVMDAAAAVFLFENSSVAVYMTDSDVTAGGASGFRRNLFTILAECRAKGAVVNPLAAASVVTTPPVAGAAASASASGRSKG